MLVSERGNQREVGLLVYTRWQHVLRVAIIKRSTNYPSGWLEDLVTGSLDCMVACYTIKSDATLTLICIKPNSLQFQHNGSSRQALRFWLAKMYDRGLIRQFHIWFIMFRFSLAGKWNLHLCVLAYNWIWKIKKGGCHVLKQYPKLLLESSKRM